ncbi:tRNA pseudouridine(38-40) synthase TruA [Leptothrix ochracea]|uniref:tRNA pseudouridine(38-40) synthase TruA n=1 Tax=Leptothrix ochracea TaxID=735331 RepID=UPI0034E2439E
MTPSSRIALGISYRGSLYRGWQVQKDGLMTVQGSLENAIEKFTEHTCRTACAGRTDAGVHALNQVVHFDAPVRRDMFSWVRGLNAFLPSDIAVRWAREVDARFDARNAAMGRRYRYILFESPTRPSIENGLVGWTFKPINVDCMRESAAMLLGEHDFSAFRSSQCQAKSPIKILREINISKKGNYLFFDFEASAFLHHMVRNIMGSLLMVGSGVKPTHWMQDILLAQDRKLAAPTFSPDGLYFIGPRYEPSWGLPETGSEFQDLWALA